LADVVRAAFTDKEWSVRAAAAHVVAMHPFPEMREKLVPLLDDKKQAVQVRAAAAYVRLEYESKTLPDKHHTSTHRAVTAAPAKTTHS
jgi:HEAT repeat protein